MSDGGKGSQRRPSQVSEEVLANNWARIFANNPDNTGVDKNEYQDLLSTEDCWDDADADTI